MLRPTVFAGTLRLIWTMPRALPFVAASVLLLPQNAAAQTIYEDGTFELGTAGAGGQGWTERGPFALPEEAGPGDMDSEQLATGGNPDSHLRFTIAAESVPMGESSQAWGILINEDAAYDPATLGAIERVDFDFDARLPPNDVRGNRVVSLALQQDQFVWLWGAVDTRLFVDEALWRSKWIFGLEASDFIPFIWMEPGQPANPDFSVNGSPIVFGLLTGTSCPTTSDCSLTPVPSGVDVDNWKVAVNDSGLSLVLSVEQQEDGPLPELPLQFLVSATVRNAGPSEASDIDVRFLLPKEALAGFSIPEAEIVEGPPQSRSVSRAPLIFTR